MASPPKSHCTGYSISCISSQGHRRSGTSQPCSSLGVGPSSLLLPIKVAHKMHQYTRGSHHAHVGLSSGLFAAAFRLSLLVHVLPSESRSRAIGTGLLDGCTGDSEMCGLGMLKHFCRLMCVMESRRCTLVTGPWDGYTGDFERCGANELGGCFVDPYE